jgi:hypothetical protein
MHRKSFLGTVRYLNFSASFESANTLLFSLPETCILGHVEIRPCTDRVLHENSAKSLIGNFFMEDDGAHTCQ